MNIAGRRIARPSRYLEGRRGEDVILRLEVPSERTDIRRLGARDVIHTNKRSAEAGHRAREKWLGLDIMTAEDV